LNNLLHNVKPNLTRQAVYVLHNVDAHSCNHGCGGKAIEYYALGVRVCGFQHAAHN